MVDLESFHGPLDLLLFLIDKNEVDIYDIPIAFIADQYVQYLQSTGQFDLENIGEFLIMATYLLNLKSRMLLPRPEAAMGSSVEDEADPREELVQKLLDYRRFREAGQYLQEREASAVARVFYRQVPAPPVGQEELIVDLAGLVRAYRSVIRRLPMSEPESVLPENDVNVSEKMEVIMELLKAKPAGVTFAGLFAEVSRRREALAMFLALLELIRLQKIRAVQSAPWETIYIEIW